MFALIYSDTAILGILKSPTRVLTRTLVFAIPYPDTAVYPMYEILGWYTVGTEVTELDLGIQRQVR